MTPGSECNPNDGYKDARKELREERVNGAKFNVLLTHYDLVMYDKTWLSKIGWNYIVVDEVGLYKSNPVETIACKRLVSTLAPMQ